MMKPMQCVAIILLGAATICSAQVVSPLEVDEHTLLLYHFDGDGAHVKTLTFEGWRQIKGVWTPFEMVMRNHERDSRTVIAIKKVKYNAETDDSKFTTRFLTTL